MAFKKALIERALGAELSHHLGYPPGAAKVDDASNHRNGASGKTVLTEDGPLQAVRSECYRLPIVMRQMRTDASSGSSLTLKPRRLARRSIGWFPLNTKPSMSFTPRRFASS